LGFFRDGTGRKAWASLTIYDSNAPVHCLIKSRLNRASRQPGARMQRLGNCRYASSRLTPHSSQLSHLHLTQRAHRRQTPFPRRPLRRAPVLPSFTTCSRHASWQPLRLQLPLLRPPWPTSPPSNSIHPPPRLQTLQNENKGRKPCKSFSPGPRSQWCVSLRFSTRLANACCTCVRVVNRRQKGLHWLQRP